MSLSISSSSCAVVVMDFQPSIMATLPDAGSPLARAVAAVEAARAAGATVTSVRVAFTPGELAAFPEHSTMGQRMRSFADKVMADAPTTQVAPELAIAPADISVRKTRVGPFGTTDLAAQLRRRGIDTLALAGIHSSGCVLTGVREAHDLDFRVIVLEDACADPDPAVHAFLTGHIFPKQAEVMTVAEFAGALAPKAA